ncbi:MULTISPECIES: CitMHS family transporter [Carnobacterium]|uniref:CitMHS family transporter n=1 Tax=Carnobacterium TaxID=2747 RepID=UPI00191BAE78|nr:citrate:proton symporter [Carnobacterium maltaromaticum]CAD5896423.1 Citrate:H+ symporter [Carnobacterium maltaromaticum]CAD5896693.1 Citrate:H+ symporter [Carnobacterium maltaromaticum]
MDFLMIIGFVLIVSIVYLLISGKASPIVVFTILPLVAAGIAGTSLVKLGEFVSTGVASMVTTASLFAFSIAFFGLMNDVGAFDIIVNPLLKVMGNNVFAVMAITVTIAIIGHLDGAGASTALITIPPMLPLYKKMKIRPTTLLLLLASSVGAMNIMPWAGPTIRAATVIGESANTIWRGIIPMQFISIALTFGLAFIMSRIEVKRGAGMSDSDFAELKQNTGINKAEVQVPKSILIFDVVLVFATIAALVADLLPANVTFMIAFSLALVLNVKDTKQQSKMIKRYGESAMPMIMTLFAVGIFLGVLQGTGMIESMAGGIIQALPKALGPVIHIVVSIFSVPLILFLGTDSFYFGVLPIVTEVAGNYGVDAMSVARVMLVTENVGLMISPAIAVTYLACGLAGVELKDHIKANFKWLWGLSIVLLIIMVILGIS